MFSKTYSYTEYNADIIESDYKGFIFSIYKDNLFSPGVLSIVKIDSNGNVIESEIVDDNVNYDRRTWVNSMIRLSNGNLCQIYPKDENKLILVFFDDALNQLGTKQFTKPYDFRIGGVYQVNDSSLFITGMKNSYSAQKNSFIINTDLDGIERWTKNYGDPNKPDGVTVLFNTNNKLILIGNQFSNGDHYLHFIEMDYSGVISKDTVLPVSNFSDIDYHPDYGLYGYTKVKTNIPSPYFRHYIHKFNSDYSFEWTKEMFPDSTSYYQMGKIAIGNQGEVTIAGLFAYFNNNSPKHKAHFLQINSNGEILQSKNIKHDSATSGGFRFLQSTSDNGFILVGTTTIGMYVYSWIAKVNSEGCFSLPCIVSVPELPHKNKGELICYPNPSNGFGTLKGTFKNAGSNNEIKVFNSLGQLVFSKSIAAKEFEMEVNLPNSGLYLVNLYQGDVLVESKKWVVQ